MVLSPGAEPVADDELLYRRVPVSTGWFNPQLAPPLSPKAFHPNRNDTTGISLSRAKHKTVEEAARGKEGKSYYIVVLCAGDLRRHGIEVIPAPTVDDPGHTELPGLKYADRQPDEVLEWEKLLAHQLCLKIEGPFPR